MKRNAFQDKVVVVTGASSGVGRAIARAFGAGGARVGLLARNDEALENAAAEIRASGGSALVLPTDVSDAAAVDRAADAVVEAWGRIDYWVNDAMVSVLAPVAETSAEEYARVTAVSYLGTVYGTLAALRHMRPRNKGHIIQVSSALAYRSIPLQSAYCAAKSAARGFTDSLRSELLHDRSKVRVSALKLPAVNTPQFDVVRSKIAHECQPVPPIFQPEVIAEAALYLALHPQRELWIGGSVFQAIIGQKFIPGLLDRYLARVGYDGQQTAEPRKPRPDNLMAPMAGDRGARGRFDSRASSYSLELWMRTHPLVPIAALVAAGGLAFGLWRWKSKR